MATPEEYLSATWAGSTGYEIAMLAVTVMFMMAGIALGLGIAFRSRWLSEWGKGELTQSMINGALVGGLITLFGAGGVVPAVVNSLVPSTDTVLSNCALNPLCSGTCAATGIADATPICYALKYLYVLQGLVTSMIIYLTMLIPLLSMLASLTFNAIIASLAPFSGLSAFVSVFSHILEMLIILSILLLAQTLFLKFIYTASLTVLLPTGLVLRSFYMTRRLGGAIMAIAIGLAVIFPLTFVLDGQLVSQSLVDTPNQTQSNHTNLSDTITNATTVGGLVDYNNSQSGGIPNTDAFSNKVNASQNATSQISSDMNSITSNLTSFLANVMVMVVILPIFNIMVTLISVKELSALLGAEVGGGKFEPF